MTFPKIIHQIWLGNLQPPQMCLDSWKSKHPSWDYILWNEKNMPALKNQRMFNGVTKYHLKSDVLRYEVLEKYGGVYMDADTYCIKPIDDLLVYDAWTVREDSPPTIASGMIGVQPGHGAILEMIERIGAESISKTHTWRTIGPGLWAKVVQNYPDIVILENDTFLPVSINEMENLCKNNVVRKNFSKSYGLHLWGSTIKGYTRLQELLEKLIT